MRWQGRRQSENVEDRRMTAPVMIGGGLGALVLALAVWLLGGDPTPLLDNVAQQVAAPGDPAAPGQPTGPQDEMSQFVGVVLADTEDVWNELFRRMGRDYQEPRLVLFKGSVQSACGYTNAAVGPFYCPADGKVYIDLSFYDDLRTRFKAPGDFAQAYVIAHEVGHHVQNLLGISDKVNQMRSQVSEAQANDLSVRLELQADFFAGVWATSCAENEEHSGKRRFGRSPERSDRHWRRPHADAGTRFCRARVIHPRHVGAASGLVPPRPADGRHDPGRHVLRLATLVLCHRSELGWLAAERSDAPADDQLGHRCALPPATRSPSQAVTKHKCSVTV